MLSASYNSSKLVNVKRRARRHWQCSRSHSAKLKFTEATNKLRNTLHQEEDQKTTNYIENLSRSQNTKYCLWKATKTIKPQVESETPLRKLNSTWARCAEDKAILFASDLSEVFQPNSPKNEFCLPAIQ